MYSFVNAAIPLSFKGKNAERQVLSDVVSAMDRQTIGDPLCGYRYQYDGLGRLTSADYLESGHSSDRYVTEYSYDLMGNILTLSRSGKVYDEIYGITDDLTYQYDGNRLIRVTNHAADTPAYKNAMYYADGADLDTERTYDANGNMTSNADSRISRISYDALNIPCRIDYIDGSHIDYTYAADGAKQRVDYYLNPYTSSLPDDDFGTACDSSLLVHTWREYAGNCVYVCDTLSMILIDGGYITFDYATHQPIYHYYLKDYLGNNRITVSLVDGRIEEVNHYYPFGGLMGDSRNATTQPYKYIGKELDRTHGLDWYDHGARHYDPVTGRWNTMDKMCEKYYDVSPYASCGDDPVNAVDPDGNDIYIVYTDKNGHDWAFRFSGFQGRKSITIPNNQFVKDFMQAYLYNGKNGGGKNTIRAATNPKYKIYLRQSSASRNHYDNSYNEKTVFWMPRKGLETSNGGKQSAATVLEHEMSHAVSDSYNHKDFDDRSNTKDKQYDDKEERRVIRYEESETAKANHESVRYDHKGEHYRTNSPTSTEPVSWEEIDKLFKNKQQ